jgi:hypothetical protein
MAARAFWAMLKVLHPSVTRRLIVLLSSSCEACLEYLGVRPAGQVAMRPTPRDMNVGGAPKR